jgi:starch phosphorylase
MMKLQVFNVIPALPASLSFLETLSRNLWWCWHLDTIELFRRIDPRLWSQCGRNPIAYFSRIHQNRWRELSTDEGFISHLKRVKERYEKEVISSNVEPQSDYEKQEAIVYMSMEYGIHESLPLFAGGLGVLAGDYLKAGSDLGLPIISIGLLYREGYFHQFLDQQGWQQEENPEIEISHLPLERIKDSNGEPLKVSVQGPEGDIHAGAWKIQVGRIPLILLDSNMDETPPHLRKITDRLYSSNYKIRLAQEILLGVGGMRVLKAMGIFPSICHINEGHAAFATIERLHQIMAKHNIDLETAMEIGPRTTVFTTHTPVAAGHDEFATEEVRPYMLPIAEHLGTSVEQVLSWGQTSEYSAKEKISMFVLGLKMSMYRNGVSELHGKVARRMWSHVWKEWPEDEVPITNITNGIHIPSWISIENAILFERYLGPDWYLKCWNSDIFKRIDDIYDDEIWRAHEMARSRLIRFCRSLLGQQYRRRNAPRTMIEKVESVLDPDVLTISFARRFTAYKRVTLLLKDPDRLENMLNNKRYPIQIIFSGKAHPKDDEGKHEIKKLFDFSQRESVRHRIVFLEDYDINIARHLVQGSDVWLNTPRRPLEASGTSGMKAAANGVLNVSILDGWWAEGYSEQVGWAIGQGEEFQDAAYQDMVESQALYNVLEYDVIPCYYEHKNGKMQGRWINMMKESMKQAMARFCTHRMMSKYQEQFYSHAIQNYRTFTDNDSRMAKEMLGQKLRLHSLWKGIQIKTPVTQQNGPMRAGDSFRVTSEVTLGEIHPDEVVVELYCGSFKSLGVVSEGRTEPMEILEKYGNGNYLYGCTLKTTETGRFGFTVRVVPKADDFLKYRPEFISWA